MIYLKLKSRNTEPPGGHRFIDEKFDGFQTVASTIENLFLEAAQHRRVNKHPVPANFNNIIEDWLCRQLPPSMVMNPLATHPVIITYSAVMQATQKLLLEWRNKGRLTVDRELAEKRARVCLACPMRKANAACSACRGLIPWVRNWTSRKLDCDDELMVCEACGVMNHAQVWMNREVIHEAQPEAVLERHHHMCWKITEGDSDNG